MSSNANNLSPVGHFSLGVLSDVFAVVATQPLDTVATNVMNGNGIPPFSRLWHGTAANCSGALVQGGLPFFVNGVLKGYYSQGRKLTNKEELGLSTGTGVVNSFGVTPFERWAKIHQIYGGTFTNAGKKAVKHGLFKALLPVMARDAGVFGSFFGGRKIIEQQLEGLPIDGWMKNLMASVFTGAFAGAATAPMANLAVKMNADIAGVYPSFYQTFKTTISTQGARGLVQGTPARSAFLAAYMGALGVGEKYLPALLPSRFKNNDLHGG